MKGFGVGIVRWLVGLILGIVAAAILFGLAARVTSDSSTAASVESLALLMAGFGVAFFPSVFVAGTRSPRQVARRGLIGIAVEGLIALVLGGYQLIAGSALVPSGAFGWLDAVTSGASGIAALFSSNLLVAVIGLALMAVCLFLAIALRVPGAPEPAAPTRAVAPAARADAAPGRPPAISQPRSTTQAAPTQPPPSALPKADDDDAKLMADLENLRKRLPKMGIDESGSGGKS